MKARQMAELSEAGILLHAEFEAGPDGGIATKSYLCPANIWTLALGVTEWPNGRAVGPNDFCTLEQAIELTNWSLRKFAACVDRVITKPMNPNQRSAFILLAYNIGEHAFEFDCTAARLFNEGADPIDVATAFGRWCKATSKQPGASDIGNAYYTPIMAQQDGKWIWVNPDGGKTTYFRAMPGLLRASLSKACLFMSLDWRQACRKDTVSISSRREWDPRDNRWEDLVNKKTEFPDVYVLAKRHPLEAELILDRPIQAAPPLEVRVPEAVGAEAVPAQPAQPQSSPKVSPAPPVVIPASAEKQAPVVPPSKPAPAPVQATLPTQVGTKPIHPETKMPDGIPYGVDPAAGAKPMEATERFIGSAMMWLANILRVGMANGLKLTGPIGMVAVFFLDMMKTPVTAALVCGGVVAAICAIGWFFGVVLEKAGLRKKRRGEVSATQLMY